MVYVDPKDTKIVTDDGVLYQAWEDRKNLRQKHFVMGREIAALDDFISTYISRVCPQYRSELSAIGVVTNSSVCTSTSTVNHAD